MTVLGPGMYFIEMAFDREVDLPTLSRALGRMGFEKVVFDQSLSEPSTGATLFRAATQSTSSAPKITSPVTQSIAAPSRRASPTRPIAATSP